MARWIQEGPWFDLIIVLAITVLLGGSLAHLAGVAGQGLLVDLLKDAFGRENEILIQVRSEASQAAMEYIQDEFPHWQVREGPSIGVDKSLTVQYDPDRQEMTRFFGQAQKTPGFIDLVLSQSPGLEIAGVPGPLLPRLLLDVQEEAGVRWAQGFRDRIYISVESPEVLEGLEERIELLLAGYQLLEIHTPGGEWEGALEGHVWEVLPTETSPLGQTLAALQAFLGLYAQEDLSGDLQGELEAIAMELEAMAAGDPVDWETLWARVEASGDEALVLSGRNPLPIPGGDLLALLPIGEGEERPLVAWERQIRVVDLLMQQLNMRPESALGRMVMAELAVGARLAAGAIPDGLDLPELDAEVREEAMAVLVRAEPIRVLVQGELESVPRGGVLVPVGEVRGDLSQRIGSLTGDLGAWVSALVGSLVALWFLLTDQALVVSGQKAQGEKSLGYSLVVAPLVLGGILWVGGGSLPGVGALHWLGMGLVLGVVIYYFSERLAPVSGGEVLAGISLGLGSGEVLREILAPEARPGVLSLVSHWRRRFV